MAWTESTYANGSDLATQCAMRIGDAIDRALAERGRAVIALAGGRTSPPILHRLAAQPRDWTRVTVLPSDERWVARDHDDCNLRQLRAALSAAAGIQWLPLVPDKTLGPVHAAFANRQLAEHDPHFDVCMLGMGSDGHVASLFPGANNLELALSLDNAEGAVAIVPYPMPAAGPHPRISLTLARIVASRQLLLVITGEEKRAVIERARAGAVDLPVTALLDVAHPAAEIHWSP